MSIEQYFNHDEKTVTNLKLVDDKSGSVTGHCSLGIVARWL